jgi:hypothetical protein
MEDSLNVYDEAITKFSRQDMVRHDKIASINKFLNNFEILNQN